MLSLICENLELKNKDMKVEWRKPGRGAREDNRVM
jgi:hypothetical protein